ncbi:RNA polymerase sigma factor [Mucilaginibacter ginsenosidivorans]|jgi:RNA polymerase sigma-70 factor (ECF subfamily)|uniref:RNA polymerase sigma factor n=1 Tax=Mucilaginibacter ginsenosidivorans TaxID=398053 RepID=A0A5B8UVC2_9SPHI|nr:RNA polymerase sigma factor [Mucilaginibacter ginsenosidivorans]QEC62291.1 RNA polymerase sigma factor [Mucilaginibacter ginsenosidivorans]
MDNSTIKDLSDEQIVARIVGGEQQLYENLMRKYNSRMYRISMSIINDNAEAEDIMQIAYINAYRQLANYRQQSSFGTWLTRILINESLLHKKRKTKKDKALMETTFIDEHHETPLNGLMNKELKSILEQAVASLPEKYRLVFMMREVQGMSTNETMEVLALGESNVKIRLTRAKEMLRAELSKAWKPEQIYEFNLVRCDVIVNYVMNKINQGLF